MMLQAQNSAKPAKSAWARKREKAMTKRFRISAAATLVAVFGFGLTTTILADAALAQAPAVIHADAPVIPPLPSVPDIIWD
jgi:hypothetical protein